jgi:enolase
MLQNILNSTQIQALEKVGIVSQVEEILNSYKADKINSQEASTQINQILDDNAEALEVCFDPTKQALDYIQEAANKAGYEGSKCEIALDCASSEFYDKDENIYDLDGKKLDQAGLAQYYFDLTSQYPIISIEDGMSEDDILGWKVLTKLMGMKIDLVGDDLFVTNPKRFKSVGLENQIGNAVLIKLNQIGSVVETCQMINDAHENGYATAVSHRSGETTDDFMSDLAFAAQSKYIKLGATARGERVAKFNRLLAIYDQLD